MSHPDKNQPPDFASRFRKRPSCGKDGEVKIVEAENDFPFLGLDFIRVGSAHNVSKPENDFDNADLLERIANHVLSVFQPEKLSAKIEIEHK